LADANGMMNGCAVSFLMQNFNKTTDMNRKSFLQKMVLSAGGAAALPLFLNAQTTPAGKPPAADPVPAEKVKEFVGAAHGKFDVVKQLLTEFPNLLYCSWDWGGGDFETGLEAAGHVGHKEIATHLLGLGGRPNIFVMTMLGQTALVKPILETYPQFLNSKGPHGLTLLHHAQKGGEGAIELLEYLQSKGMKETKLAMY
jgi:hypothetical protein